MLVAAGLLLAPPVARAQPGGASEEPPAEAPPPEAPPAEPPSAPAGDQPPAPGQPDEAQLAEARRLFEQGNAMRKTGDHERALSYYVASRAVVRSVASTLNAAVCLDELGRYDEALELFEELLTSMGDRLSDEDRATIAARMGKLRALVGSVDVQANTDGVLVIDGRPRGKLPLVAPVRVLPGEHRVVVTKDGYRSFEMTVDVHQGRVTQVAARLEVLAASEPPPHDDPVPPVAEVPVDGAAVDQGTEGQVLEELPEEEGHFWVDVVGGLAIAPTLSSGPEQSCGTSTADGRYQCSSDPAALGVLAGARGGYEFPLGLSIELGAGYLQVSKTLERVHDTTFTFDGDHANVPVRYIMTDELSLGGPFVVGGGGYRLGFAEIFELRAHLLLGALFGSASDELTATVTTGETVPAEVHDGSGAPADDAVQTIAFLVLPEVHAGLRFGGFGVSLGVSAAIAAGAGDDFAHDRVAPTGSCPALQPGQTPSPSCLAGKQVVSGEQSFGPFVAIVPSLAVSYLF